MKRPAADATRPAWVRALRRGRFVVASVALHGVMGAALLSLRAREVAPRRAPIEVAVGVVPKPEAEVVPPPVAPPPIAPPAVERPPGVTPPPERTRPRAEVERSARPEAERPRDEEPASEAPADPGVAVTPPSTTPAEPAPAKRPVDLFARGALERATGGTIGVPAPRGFGGTTRRAGDGLAPPGARDHAADRAEAGDRIRDFVADAVGAERARSGRVPPVWRDAERRVMESFSPPAALVTDDNALKGWLKSRLAARPTGGDTPRGVDPSSQSAWDQAYAQSMAGQNPGTSGAPSVRAEIEVVLDGSGAVVSARVTRPSGRRKFDQEALAAVRKDIEAHVPVAERQGVVTRWSVEATVTVAGPLAAGFGFDEVKGKVNGVHPFKKETRTRVALLSVLPRP